MRLATRFFLLAVTLSGLVACGQKGPLFVPDEEKLNQAKTIKQAVEQHKAEAKAKQKKEEQ